MKKILKKIFLITGLAAMLSACTSDPNYDWASPEDGLKLYFAEDAPATYELEENQSSFSFWVYRSTSVGDLTVDIDAASTSAGAADLFTVPTTAVFKDGESKARVRVLYKFSEIEGEKEYGFAAAIKAPDNYSIYGPKELKFNVVFYPEWDSAGSGIVSALAYNLFGLPTSATAPIQHKPGTNFYRIPRLASYVMEANADAFIADGYDGSEENFKADLEAAKKSAPHLVFQLNDVNKNDGAPNWNFYRPFAGEAGYVHTQEEGSFMQRAGAKFYDFVTGWNYFYCTPLFNAGLASNCSFSSNSTIDHNYVINTIYVNAAGNAYKAGFTFSWVKNAFVPDSEWVIATDYNSDFTYKEQRDAKFTSKGFDIDQKEIVLNVSPDKDGLFYLPDAFGVAGYGLAFFVNDSKVTIPADQPTGKMQQGMMVLAGPGVGGSVIKDGVCTLNMEYYQIEKTVTPGKPSEGGGGGGELPGPVPPVDADGYEWPSGKIGEGERFEKTEPAPAPEPGEPEDVVTTRRISLGTFAEKLEMAAQTTVDDFVGTYDMIAPNFGFTYLTAIKQIQYYPGVKKTVNLKVTIEKGEKADEVYVKGLFTHTVNGDSAFAPKSFEDKVKGIFNEAGGYILIYPQTLEEKVIFPSSATGKPDRKFAVTFSTYNTTAGAADTKNTPLKLYLEDGDKLVVDAASDETKNVNAYTFYSAYDNTTPLNYDIPVAPFDVRLL